MNKRKLILFVTLAVFLLAPFTLFAQDPIPTPPKAPEAPSDSEVRDQFPVPIPDGIFSEAKDPRDVVTALEIVFILTILTLAPAILVLMTSFTRIVIVLSFVRRALSTQELPPNQVMVGLALILTFLVMSPTFYQIKDEALVPYMDKEITLPAAMEVAEGHMRKFLLAQTRNKDLELFYKIHMKRTSQEIPESVKAPDIPTSVVVPAFVISELRRGFIMGFAILLPFVVIDLVVATTLISMGMLVLPPILISLPFKILLFILVDGWHLVVGSVVLSFGST